MDLIGKILGNRYEVLEKIGNGGMATVYRAKDKTLGRNVAIKVLKEEYANDQEFIKRFQIEAQSAASLSHPNIVSIYDVSNDQDIHYIVMEYIEGKTLKDVIKNEGKLDWKESAEIASQIASGLSVAHKNHIIHRDIKPHNIIITKDDLAKITDFGIAKAATSSTINANSSSMGSVHYFSPEHARGGYTDEKSDIYSLGIVLYEMVTGKLPFDGDSPVSIAMKHLKETPIAPIELAPSMPMGLNDIILKAMQKEVSSRYSSAHEMYNDLQKLLKDPNIKNVGLFGESDMGTTQKIPKVSATTARIAPVRSTTTSSRKEEVVVEKTNDKKGVNMSKSKAKRKSKSPIAGLIKLLIIAMMGMGLIAGIVYVSLNFIGGSPVETIEVPSVVGDSKDVAQKKLEQLGFVVEISDTEEESDYPKGYVAKQGYTEGKKLSKGSKITITVSSGPKKVVVPNVEGFSLTAAQTVIRNSELSFKVIEEESDDVAADKIIRQEPRSNSTAFAGDEVTLYVSKGLADEKCEVPDVSKDKEAEAIEKLQALGFKVAVSRMMDDTKEDGEIINQSPAAGTIQMVGSTIYLIVNTLKEEVVVLEPVIQEPVVPTTKEEPATSTKEENSTSNPDEKATSDETEKYEILKINLSRKGTKDTFVVRVELNGDIKNRKVIYEKTHKRSDGLIEVKYPADATGILRVYIDDKFDSEQVIR